MLHNLFDLFATPLTPKSEEIVAYTLNRTWEEAKQYFEEGLKKAFKEILVSMKEKGKTLVIITHDLDFFVPLADEFVVLKEGKVMFSGRKENFINLLPSHMSI